MALATIDNERALNILTTMNTNEMPKEAGERWACKPKTGGHVMIGKINMQETSGMTFSAPGLWFDGSVSFHENSFDQYDWHRIELPEGWR